MDPLSGFSLAASIVQFINFATNLIHKSIEIYDSGSTAETKSLEDTYETLNKFSCSLGSSGIVDNIVPELSDQAISLQTLSKSCQNDCDKLLSVVSKLKTVGSARRRLLKTFKIAWETLINDDKIASLERRLARSQSTLTLCICQMSNHYISIHSGDLYTLKREAANRHLHQDAQFTRIQAKLDEFKLIVQEKKLSQATTFSGREMEILHEKLSTFSILKIEIARDHRFLDSLAFKRQPERYKQIPKAHTQTFSWILDPASTGTEASRLRRWFEAPGGGIFWVSGKPGSGKSTLMKFVADNVTTKRILSTWAAGRKLVIASHYFWWSGTSLQKSQEGLLRTLLYSILQQCPDLIRVVCNDRWARGPNAATLRDAENSGTGSWTLEELHSAFNAIAHYPNIPVRFCFFVDGLDEYEGEHKEICDIFIELAKASSAIKICLSSRPWNVFEQALGNEQEKIYIHELTREDIRNFAQSRLSKHLQWETISKENPEVKTLVNKITERAQGVFLWVFLVTGLLSEGLNNGDSFSDLQLRLDTFPSDLKRFFRDILERVDSFYYPKVSAVLQIALTAEEPLNISLYAFLEEEVENRDYALNKQVGVISNEAVKKRQRVMTQRLNGWSKGLVEVRNQEVHFLHRTVADFLKTREMKQFIAGKLPSWFVPCVSLLKAHLAWIKTSNFADSFKSLRSDQPTTLGLRVREGLRWAFEIELTIPASSPVHDTVELLLDDMERSIEILRASASFDDERETKRLQAFFRESVLRRNLAGYLSRRLVSPDYLQCLDKPALSFPLAMRESGTSWPEGLTDTLRCLLKAGQDPNQEYRANGSPTPSTPWTKFLSGVIAWDAFRQLATKTPGDLFVSAIHDRLFSLFLDHGADPHAMIFRTGQNSPVFSTAWVDMLMMSLETSTKPVDAEVYFAELNAFLDHGAKFDTATVTRLSRDLVTNGDSAYASFFSQLPRRYHTGECNAKLLERVAGLLLRKMQDSGIALDSALIKVSAALPPATSQRLRIELETRGNSNVAGSRKRKKRRGAKSSGGGKRQRTL